MLAPWKKSYDKPRQRIQNRDVTLPTNVCLVKAIVFPVVMYRCESWTIKKTDCLRNDAFEVQEKTLYSPLDSKEIESVSSKGNQPWIFIGRTEAEAKVPLLWSPDAKSQLIKRDPDAGKDWGHGEKRVTENEMVEWHHWLNGYEFEQTGKPGVLQSMGSQRVRRDLVTEQQQ